MCRVQAVRANLNSFGATLDFDLASLHESYALSIEAALPVYEATYP